MAKPEALNKEALISSLEAAQNARQHFKNVVDKFVQTKRLTLDSENEQLELKKLEESAKLRFEQTMDDSVFTELEAKRQKLTASKQHHAFVLGTLRGVLNNAAQDMNRTNAAIAEQGSLQWAMVANETINDIEQQAIELLLKSLFIRRKVNNGNYSRGQFHESIGLDALKTHLETLLEEVNIRKTLDKVVNDLPDIPYLPPLANNAYAIIERVQNFENQSGHGAWENMTAKQLCREI